MIDGSLVLGDIVFQTHHDRAVFIGMSIAERRQWLELNSGRWRPINPAAAAGSAETMPTLITSEILVPAAPANKPGHLSRVPSVPAGSEPPPLATCGPGRKRKAGAVDLLRILAPEGPWTVRSISSHGGAPMLARELGYAVGPHNSSEHDTGIHDWIAAAHAAKHNCYLHVAVGADDKVKLSRRDVIGSRAVWTDVDPDGKENPISSEADFQERRSAILTAMLAEDPPFSCIVDSGNGFQAYKFIDSYRVDGEPDRLATLEAANKAINDSVNQRLAGTELRADNCYSADHLMRLPDTVNFLTAKKKSYGYPEGDRPAHIVHWHPERVYKLEDLPATPEKISGLSDRSANQSGDDAGSLTLDQLKLLLSALDPKNFRDGARWRSLLWACHHGTKGEGRAAFIEWSALDPQFAGEKYKTGATWDRAKDDRENSITVGTLFHEVKEAGRSDLLQQVRASRFETAEKWLEIGSDVEIAQRVLKDVTERSGPIVHTEGWFWRYSSVQWEPIPEHELRRVVHTYDGALYGDPSEPAKIRLGKGRIDSVLNECATLCEEPNFFNERPTGINCRSGFIRLNEHGTPSIEPHHRDHRCRHMLPGSWKLGAAARPSEGSLLHRLLDGIFQGDPEATEKVALLSEVCGSAALGYATQLTQPRAVILFGKTAENGKSQILNLARGLLPSRAICSVPAARMGDERHIIGLVGKLLNATDELSSGAIASDTFKSVVTGEPVEGRDVYKSRVEFRSTAQNLFATNSLPPFQGGMDRGVQRRLLVIPFNRTIPMEERVENIGLRIAEEEADLLLAWAVEGACCLVRHHNFSIPASCKRALDEWIYGADPVLAWLSECTSVRPVVDHQPALATREAYKAFFAWAVAEGFKTDKLPAINGFVQRVTANAAGVEHRRTGKARQFEGLEIKSTECREVPF